MRRFCVICGHRPSMINKLVCIMCASSVEELIKKIVRP